MATVKLLQKELRDLAFSGLVMLLLNVLFYGFLLFQADAGNIPIILSFVTIPFAVYPLYLLAQGYRSFTREWKNETIYMLKSLPRSGYALTAAKALASALMLALLVAASGAGIYLILISYSEAVQTLLPPEIATINLESFMFWAGLAYLWGCAVVYFAAQISALISRVFLRFRWLAALATFYLVNYLVLRFSGYLARPFTWLPGVTPGFMETAGIEQGAIQINSNVILAGILTLLILFAVSSLILDRVVEV